MPVEWRESSMSTGIPWVDDQHRALMDTLNDLVDKLSAGNEDHAVGPALAVSCHWRSKPKSPVEHIRARAALRSGPACAPMLRVVVFDGSLLRVAVTAIGRRQECRRFVCV